MDAAPYRPMIAGALAEDLGEAGDVTTRAIFGEETGSAVLVSKDSGILAGADIFIEVYRQVDPAVGVDFAYGDGTALSSGDTVAHLEGRVVSLLSGERVALNFLSYLSGIATATGRHVAAAGGGRQTAALPSLAQGVKNDPKLDLPTVLDTRKTLPGYRTLAKYAVRTGGGRNHRMGLHDMVLIKDNHIDFAGSVTTAVERVRERWGGRFVIEVECRTLEEVDEALATGADILMLDNMTREQINKAVLHIGGRAKVEVSGNMDLEKVAALRDSGVDYISVGRLTHSVTAFDFSLKVKTGRQHG